MYVERAVGIPVIKTVATLLRGISIPGGYPFLHIVPRIIGVIRRRAVRMQLAEVSAIVSGLAEHIAHTRNRIRPC